MSLDLQLRPMQQVAKTLRSRTWHFWALATLLILLAGTALIFRFGGSLLVVSEPLPKRAQAAVVLAGSATAEKARRAEALRLLQQGLADQVMLSVGKASYWGQWVPDMVRRYIENEYGSGIAQHVILCEMKVDSTAEEAVALRQCLESRGWRSGVIITSNYHTRRARLVWRATLAKADPSFTFSIHGVSDGDFEPTGWWRKRRYVKTWLLEVTKLIWTCLFGTGLWQ